MSLQTASLETVEPIYYHREYANDFPAETDNDSWLDLSKRAGIVALPFVSLYQPLSFPLSLTMGGLRTISFASDLISSIEKGSTAEISLACL